MLKSSFPISCYELGWMSFWRNIICIVIWQNMNTWKIKREAIKIAKQKRNFPNFPGSEFGGRYSFSPAFPQIHFPPGDADRRQAMTLVSHSHSHRWQRWNDAKIFTASASSLFISYLSELCLIVHNKSDHSQQMCSDIVDPQKRLTSWYMDLNS